MTKLEAACDQLRELSEEKVLAVKSHCGRMANA